MAVMGSLGRGAVFTPTHGVRSSDPATAEQEPPVNQGQLRTAVAWRRDVGR